MSKLLAVGILAALVAHPAAVVAMHDPDVTDAEFRCQVATGKADSKYLRTVIKCATKCQQGFFRGDGSALDCYAPYGGATASCAGSGRKRAGGKLRTAIDKACDPATRAGTDCPECYDAAGGNLGCGDAGYAGANEANMSGQVAAFLPGLFCKTTGASAAEQKCQQNAVKNASKLIGAVYKCYERCYTAAHAGMGMAADCAPEPNDPATQACLATVQASAAVHIDRLCSMSGVNLQCPYVCRTDADCDTTGGDGVCTNAKCAAGYTTLSPYPSGDAWAALVMIAASGNMTGNTYCGE